MCRDCKYYKEGYCYRYPPIGEYTTNMNLRRPTVMQDIDWCGEFLRKSM